VQELEGYPEGTGELVTRGPHVMKGYWADEAATAAVLSPDGWLRTGDVGRRDKDNKFWLVGRLKDVIRSGGENVSASEVERVLIRHPSVVAAAVVGLPHPRFGEQVAACVVLREGTSWSGVCMGSPQETCSPPTTAAVLQHGKQLTSGTAPRINSNSSSSSGAFQEEHCPGLAVSKVSEPGRPVERIEESSKEHQTLEGYSGEGKGTGGHDGFEVGDGGSADSRGASIAQPAVQKHGEGASGHVRITGGGGGDGGEGKAGDAWSTESLNGTALHSFALQQGLSPFMVPRVWAAQWHQLPQNSSGKVLKAEVLQQMSEALGNAARQDSLYGQSRL
jgi:acyl-CoA synthetase (AMP-forming)/AMP-acid ligase II